MPQNTPDAPRTTELPPEQAEHVRDAMRRERDEEYSGINAQLARALGMSAASVGSILSPNPETRTSPSLRTADMLARLIGVELQDLLAGRYEEREDVADSCRERVRALRRLEGLIPAEVEDDVRSRVPVGAPYTEFEWVQVAVAKTAEYLLLARAPASTRRSGNTG